MGLSVIMKATVAREEEENPGESSVTESLLPSDANCNGALGRSQETC